MSPEVSKAHATTSCFSLGLMVVVSSCKFSALLECHACLLVAILPAITVMDSALETVSPSKLFYKLHHSQCFVTIIEKQIETFHPGSSGSLFDAQFVYLSIHRSLEKNQHILKLQKWEFRNLLGKFLLERRFLNFNLNRNQLRSLLNVSFPGL